MSDIILTEAEFAALRTLVEEAQAIAQRFDWLSGTARRITRDDIVLPKLHLALDGVKGINFEQPRTLGIVTFSDEEAKLNAATERPRTSRSKK